MSRTATDFITICDDALPRDVCRLLLHAFEARPELQQANSAGVHAGLEDSARTEPDLARIGDARYRVLFRERPPGLDGC